MFHCTERERTIAQLRGDYRWTQYVTAVNIQHLETLNDAVATSAGIRVRETVPDAFLKRADEVVNVDVTVDELRTRLKQGKIYKRRSWYLGNRIKFTIRFGTNKKR